MIGLINKKNNNNNFHRLANQMEETAASAMMMDEVKEKEVEDGKEREEEEEEGEEEEKSDGHGDEDGGGGGNKQRRKLWTEDEDELLTFLASRKRALSLSWATLAAYMDGRGQHDCRKHWQGVLCVKNPALKEANTNYKVLEYADKARFQELDYDATRMDKARGIKGPLFAHQMRYLFNAPKMWDGTGRRRKNALWDIYLYENPSIIRPRRSSIRSAVVREKARLDGCNIGRWSAEEMKKLSNALGEGILDLSVIHSQYVTSRSREQIRLKIAYLTSPPRPAAPPPPHPGPCDNNNNDDDDDNNNSKKDEDGNDV